jgi:ABC-type sulfate transport system substrate-binding protein
MIRNSNSILTMDNVFAQVDTRATVKIMGMPIDVTKFKQFTGLQHLQPPGQFPPLHWMERDETRAQYHRLAFTTS